jgi:hypothetical protein
MFKIFGRKLKGQKLEHLKNRELSEQELLDQSITMSLFKQNLLVGSNVEDFVEIVLMEQIEQEKRGLDPEILKNS